jgi:ribosomal protein S18 acetylase RimI-like enzyme
MIRRARPEDAEAIAETFTASFETLLTFLPSLHTHEEHRHFINEIVPRDHEIWVAEDEGRVVGVGALGESTLGHLYVHPDFHGRGHGTALLDKAKELRPDGFTLWTFPANEWACRFYERHGLCPIEYGDGSGNEEGVPDVRYEWRPNRRRTSAAAC